MLSEKGVNLLELHEHLTSYGLEDRSTNLMQKIEALPEGLVSNERFHSTVAKHVLDIRSDFTALTKLESHVERWGVIVEAANREGIPESEFGNDSLVAIFQGIAYRDDLDEGAINNQVEYRAGLYQQHDAAPIYSSIVEYSIDRELSDSAFNFSEFTSMAISAIENLPTEALESNEMMRVIGEYFSRPDLDPAEAIAFVENVTEVSNRAKSLGALAVDFEDEFYADFLVTSAEVNGQIPDAELYAYFDKVTEEQVNRRRSYCGNLGN